MIVSVLVIVVLRARFIVVLSIDCSGAIIETGGRFFDFGLISDI